jgi:hypothetical protein
MKTYKCLTYGFSVALALAIGQGEAVAGPRIWDNSVSSCTTNNCSSLTIPGTVTNPSNNNDPFELQVFAFANECVRLEVVESISGVDLETVVRAPNGSIYRNDDGSGGGSLNNPLVKINGAPNSGWYSVSINHWNGVASYADFVLTYGRYPLNNPNCDGATSPAAASILFKPAFEAPAVLTPGVGTVSPE